MNRQMFNALAAQYATPEVSGDGLVSWDSGKKCVLPSVRLYGAAVQDGEPTPENPVMPLCNNGVFAARGRNLFDSEGFAQELLGLSGSSRVVVDGRDCIRFSNKSAYQHGAFIPFSPRGNAQHTIKISYKADGLPESDPGGLYITAYYTDGTTTSIVRISAPNAQDWKTNVVTTEAGKTISFLRLSYGTEWYWYIDIGGIQMVEGVHTADTMPPYTPYYDGGQAQAPELWTIPGTEYRDEWDPQTGRGIRRVRKIVLDGTDIKLYEPTTGYWHVFPRLDNAAAYSTKFAMCSHFSWDAFGSASGSLFIRQKNVSEYFTSLDEINEFLTDQNAAGTPVTIIYKLINPEPFTTAPAKLTMPTGYGQIIQVSGDVPDCPITARYLTHS